MTQIHPTAVIEAGAELGADVEIGAYSIVGPHVRIGDRTRIMPHVYLDGHTTLGAECTVFPFASIGSQTQDLKFKGGQTSVEIGDQTTLREYVTVNSGTSEGDVTRIGTACHIMAYSHIAHQCQVGNRVIISNGGSLAGHILVEDDAVIGGLTGIHQFVRIGRLAMVGAMSGVRQDVPPFTIADGRPAEIRGINHVGLERHGVSAEAQGILKKAYKMIYRDGLAIRAALEKIRAELPAGPELDHFVTFIEASERGIIR
jgi:UDP-N-acetylglucosamine acyltransferase